MSGGCQARSKAWASGAHPVGVRGFESHPPHHYVEFVGGFVLAMLTSIFSLPEDSCVVEVANEFEAGVARARLFFGRSGGSMQ